MNRIERLIEKMCPDGVPQVELGSICQPFAGFAFKSNLFNTSGDGFPLIRIRDVNSGNSGTFYSGDYDEKYLVRNGDLLIGMDGDFQCVQWSRGVGLLNQRVSRLQDFSEQALPRFVFFLMQIRIPRLNSGKGRSTVAHLSASEIRNILIPLPPLEIQKEIVNILDKFTELEAGLEAELEAREKQYEEVRRRLLDFESDTSNHPLGEMIREMCPEGVEVEALGESNSLSIKIGQFVKKTRQSEDFEYPVFNGGTTPTGYYNEFNFEGDSVVISARGSIGFVNYLESRFWAGNSCYVIQTDQEKLYSKYLYYWLKHQQENLVKLKSVGGIPAINLGPLSRFHFPFPPLEIQKEIVRILDNLDSLVNSVNEGIPAEIEARRKQYEYYRDKLLTFKELESA